MQGKARLRGLERIISSKTISPRLARAKPPCASRELQRRPSRLPPLASRLSPPASRLSPLASRLSPLASRLSPLASRLWNAKPTCASRELQRRPSRLPPPASRLPPLASRLSPMECKAHLRVTRTPTATLSPLASRLSPLASRLSPLASRLPPLASRLWNAQPTCASRELQR